VRICLPKTKNTSKTRNGSAGPLYHTVKTNKKNRAKGEEGEALAGNNNARWEGAYEKKTEEVISNGRVGNQVSGPSDVRK